MRAYVPIVVGQLLCFTLMEETQVAEPRWIKKLLSLVFHMITKYTGDILKMMCLSLLGKLKYEFLFFFIYLSHILYQ